MKAFSYVITDPEGVHARPAGIIVIEAKKFNSVITISANGGTADLKRIFPFMGLFIRCGDEVIVEARGSDEDSAIAALEKVFEENL